MGTVKEVYDQMLSDFTKAKNLMPEDYFVRGRANKFSAAMMLMEHWKRPILLLLKQKPE